MQVLSVKNVESGYGDLKILHGISFNVEEKKIISIVGANGVGKSTLLKTITGLIKPMSGEINFKGKRIDALHPHDIVNLGISMVPEGRQLFNNLTVLENLEIGSCSKDAKAIRKESLEEVFEYFPKLKERAKQYAGTLSGGEQQMVATARALMAKPQMIIMDEPSWGLAPLLVDEMFEQIQGIRERGTSVLVVEQNVYKTLQISDWSYVVEHGKIVMDGFGQDLLNDENLKKAYLGI